MKLSSTLDECIHLAAVAGTALERAALLERERARTPSAVQHLSDLVEIARRLNQISAAMADEVQLAAQTQREPALVP